MKTVIAKTSLDNKHLLIFFDQEQRSIFLAFQKTADQSYILILSSYLQKSTSDFVYYNLLKIFVDSTTCNSKSFTLLRIEAVLRSYSQNPVLIIQSKFQKSSEAWGFRNFTIDKILCTENCLICKDFTTCQQCQTNFILYSGKYCVEQCPIYSSNCVDYSEIIQCSRYLAKGFYDMNMTYDEVQSYFDSSSNPSTKTGQKFSFFPDKFVLGGLMVWNGEGTYTKTLHINQPHYAVTIRFNFTFGDEFSGNFIYKINGVSSISYTKSGNTWHLNPFKTETLTIEFQCTGDDSDFRKNFCAISEYFIVVHYCLPFCSQCSDELVCEIWDTGYTSSNCPVNQYLQFNSLTEIYSCQNCNQEGCSTCISSEQCTSCITNQYYLLNGQCFCYPFSYLSNSKCLKCSKYCESCDGPLDTNCITCVSGREQCDDSNFYAQDGCYQNQYDCPQWCTNHVKGQCLECKQIGYQLNQCISICINVILIVLNVFQVNVNNVQKDILQIKNTIYVNVYVDQIKSDDEQCDNGNKLGDDGCFDCKFQCHQKCVLCVNGECLQCEGNGWALDQVQKDCVPLCGDGIIIGNEQCDDANDEDNDGCNSCYFHAKMNVQSVQKEFVLNVERLAGSQNMANVPLLVEINQFANVEECDDGNLTPFDGCFNCQFQCQEQCTDCKNGICYQCNIEGWSLKNQKCEAICGDGILIKEAEELNTFDGCYDCQYQCEQQCTDCQSGICYDCEVDGWEIHSHKCQPICGDGIIIIGQDMNSATI